MSDTEVEMEEDEEVETESTGQSFKVKVNGEVAYEMDVDPRLVTQVKLRSAQGEAGVAGSPFTGEGNDWVELVVVIQQPTALPVVEDDARLKAQEEGPEEVLTYNEIAMRAEEEPELTPEGAAADTNGEETEPETEEETETEESPSPEVSLNT
jgi:hypothetical protein